MNIPNPFSSGLFDPDIAFRDEFSKTPRRTRKSRIRPNQKRRQQSTQIVPVIPPPDDENGVIGQGQNVNEGPAFRLTINGKPVTGRWPLKTRIARFVAWVHLILGTVYASTLVYRFGNFIIGEQPNFPFILLPLVGLVFVYIIVEAIVGAWCDVVNDILLGAVACWPEALTIEKFFDQLSEEIASNLASDFFRQLGISEVAAVIPHRPYIDSSGQSLIYMATYFGCFFYTPLSAIIKSAFWKVELSFGILFLAYLFTISSTARSQR